MEPLLGESDLIGLVVTTGLTSVLSAVVGMAGMLNVIIGAMGSRLLDRVDERRFVIAYKTILTGIALRLVARRSCSERCSER